MTPEARICDVAVIGAGLAGTSTASTLVRCGYDVVLLDTRATVPEEFRAEKLGEHQMEQFDALGLGASARAVATPMDDLWVVRYGSLVSRERKREYGFSYADLINRLRSDMPEGLSLTVGRVDDIVSGPDRQSLVLTDGRRISARLVVIATGLGDAIRRKVGISPRLISPRHSLSIGFNLKAPLSAFPFETLTYYAEAFGKKTAYLTLFPLGSVMRGNLFTYREPTDAWTKSFCAAPEAVLAALMPRLSRVCPDLAIAGRIDVRPIDLMQVQDPARDGVVLIGDAYLTACPIPGTGINKVLIDVERLCSVYVPRWLAMPRIDRDAVAAFYADPAKAANDEESLRMSHYTRFYGTQASLPWAARRGRHFLIHHMRHITGRRRAVTSTGAPTRQGDTSR